MGGSDEMSGPLRDRVFEAAMAEVVESGTDDFSIERVARRAGVDLEVVLARWRDRRVLLMDAMLSRAGEDVPVPDTGSVDEDMRRIAASLAELSGTELGRRWFRRILPGGRDADLSNVGPDFWAAQMNAVEQIFEHAAARAELRVGVDTREATRMLAAALYYDVIFADTPVRPDYARQVHEIFLYGILAPQIRDTVLIEDFENREHMRALLRATTDAMIDPVALVEAVRDDDGRVTDFTFREVNPAACVYLQRGRDELIGASMRATLPDIESSGMLGRYVQCVQTGEPVTVEDFEYFSQRYHQLRRYDLRGARAGTDWLSMTWRDVTDRYRSRQDGSTEDTFS